VRIVVTPSETSDDNKTKSPPKQSSEKSKSGDTKKSEQKKKQKDNKSQVSGDVRGLTDIHHAAHEGNFEKIKELLQKDREEALLNSKTGNYISKKSLQGSSKFCVHFISKITIASISFIFVYFFDTITYVFFDDPF
jgi:hypothetical protein